MASGSDCIPESKTVVEASSRLKLECVLLHHAFITCVNHVKSLSVFFTLNIRSTRMSKEKLSKVEGEVEMMRKGARGKRMNGG